MSETIVEKRARIARDKAQDAIACAEYDRKVAAAHAAGPEKFVPYVAPDTPHTRAKARALAEQAENRRKVDAAHADPAAHEAELQARNAALVERRYQRFRELGPAVARMDAANISHGQYAKVCAFLAEFCPLCVVTVSPEAMRQGSAPHAAAIATAIERARQLVEFYATTREKESE